MGELALREHHIPAMSDTAIEKVRAIEKRASELEQIPLVTTHVLHAGVYSRTIMLKAGTFITGALIKRTTQLIFSGHAMVYIGDESVELIGYKTMAASANRKQAFLALEDTHLTMLFATSATTVNEAEEEFTDEAHLLISRLPTNINTIINTGE